ncbi:MAG: L-serine ammonia-lyase [Planctomycetota bacterium]
MTPPIVHTPIRTRLLHVYRIGPGPSSSHTVGPMRAAAAFRQRLIESGARVRRFRVDLKGSLSATGKGHGTDRAVLGGLLGWDPETCDPDALRKLPETLAADPETPWPAGGTLRLEPEDVRLLPYRAYRSERLPHPNTMRLTARTGSRQVIADTTWVSLGGGFIDEIDGPGGDRDAELPDPALPFADAASLAHAARSLGGTLGAVVLANEAAWENDPRLARHGLRRVWKAMGASIERGLSTRGELPGGLGMRRRARDLAERVEGGHVELGYRHIARAQSYAFAISEENADGGRVVTAPTNGAAGILPAVLREATERLDLDEERVVDALATAAAIAMLIKAHASLSGAEVGCQGEVGSATAMAAASLCELLGGSIDQVAYAAEIAIEHNLGLTCDPLKGLVQAPCIERNAMGVAKAWSAAQLALHSDGKHLISLDRVIRVMRRTGEDMRREYKETGEGGLAVSLPEC